MNPLALEQLEEAVSHRVVMAIATPAHTADQVVVPQETQPFMARKLTALVGMHQHCIFGLSAPQHHQQRIEYQISVDTAAHGSANDLAREQVKHHRQVQPTLVGSDVGD